MWRSFHVTISNNFQTLKLKVYLPTWHRRKFTCTLFGVRNNQCVLNYGVHNNQVLLHACVPMNCYLNLISFCWGHQNWEQLGCWDNKMELPYEGAAHCYNRNINWIYIEYVVKLQLPSNLHPYFFFWKYES